MNLHLLGVTPKDIIARLEMAKKFGRIERKPGSGKTRTVRTSRLIREVKGQIQRNPVQSMRKMELSVSEQTIRNVVKPEAKRA